MTARARAEQRLARLLLLPSVGLLVALSVYPLLDAGMLSFRIENLFKTYILGEVDFIIAAEHATFFDPHVTYGMPAAFEPIFLLQKMPFQEVMRLSLLGANERMSAARAFQIGLVSEVVPDDKLAEAAKPYLEEMLTTSPLGLRLTKECLNFSIDAPSLEAAVAMEDRNQILCSQTNDVREGMSAFLEKRKPVYTNS